MRELLKKEDAAPILTKVLDSFTEEQRATLVRNVKAGRKLYCGVQAYIFSGENAGDLVTLSLTEDLPTHQFDFKKMRELEKFSWPRYSEIVKEHTLMYYYATQSVDEETFKAIILNHLDK